MSYLGYDPERLLRLRAFLDVMAAEHARMRFDDPLSAPAGESYGRAVSGVLVSRDRIDAVLGCGLDSAFRPVSVDVSLAVVDVMRLDDPAWVTVTDPGAASTDPVLAAVHLAEYVAATGLVDAFDPATSDDVRSRLRAVSNDPSTATAFIAALGQDDLAVLVDRLWNVMVSPFDDPERGRAKDTLAALASIVGRADRARPGVWDAYVEQALGDEHRSITAVALMAQGASLAPATLGATFTRLSAEAIARPERAPAVSAADGTFVWSTAQALTDALTGRPDVANSVVASLDDVTFGWLLTDTNPSSTGLLLWAATSPLVQTEAAAERAVENVLTHLVGVHHIVRPELRGGLGEMVAPWLSRLALPRSTYATSWEVASQPAVVGEVRWILAADDAANAATRWLLINAPASLNDVLAAGEPVQRRVIDWAEQLGVAAFRMRSAQLDDARRQLADWMNRWRIPLAIVNTATTRLVDLGTIGQFVVSQAMYAAEQRALGRVAAHGALGAPPPIDRVTVDEVDRYALIENTLVASARRTVFDRLVAAGRVPPGAEPPPAVQVDSADPMEDDKVAMYRWEDRSRPLIGDDAVAAVSDVGHATHEGFGERPRRSRTRPWSAVYVIFTSTEKRMVCEPSLAKSSSFQLPAKGTWVLSAMKWLGPALISLTGIGPSSLPCSVRRPSTEGI